MTWTMLARRWVTGCVISLLAFSYAGAADLKIVAVLPLAGDNAGTSDAIRSGVEQAVADLGPIALPRPAALRLTVVNDDCDGEVAVAVAQKLVSEGPALIIGHDCSVASIAAAPVYAAADVIEISPTSTSPRLTDMGLTTLFRTIGRDDRQGMAAGMLLARRWAGKRIALLDDGRTYGHGLAEATLAELTRRGVTPVLRLPVVPNAADYRALVSELVAGKLDAVYLGCYSLDAGLIIRQARAAGVTAVFLGGETLMSSPLGALAGAASDGVLFTYPPEPPATPAMSASAGPSPDPQTRPALQSYAAVQAWAQAVLAAGTAEGKAVAAHLHADSFDTKLGRIRFDAKGDITGPASNWVWYRWHNGKVEPAPP